MDKDVFQKVIEDNFKQLNNSIIEALYHHGSIIYGSLVLTSEGMGLSPNKKLDIQSKIEQRFEDLKNLVID